MKITLVGMGSGTPGSLTMQGLNALREAELIIGARRLLESLPDGCTGNRAPLYKIEEICALLRTTEAAHVAVAYSGDTGFYSGASALCRALEAAGLPYMVCPGLSSVQLLAAALGRPWQDWKLVSAHGAVIRSLLMYLKAIPHERFWEGTVSRNCGVTVLEAIVGRVSLLAEDVVFYGPDAWTGGRGSDDVPIL